MLVEIIDTWSRQRKTLLCSRKACAQEIDGISVIWTGGEGGRSIAVVVCCPLTPGYGSVVLAAIILVTIPIPEFVAVEIEFCANDGLSEKGIARCDRCCVCRSEIEHSSPEEYCHNRNAWSFCVENEVLIEHTIPDLDRRQGCASGVYDLLAHQNEHTIDKVNRPSTQERANDGAENGCTFVIRL